MADVLDAGMKKRNLISESDFNEIIKTLATKKHIKTLATKAKIKAGQDKIVKFETSYSSYFEYEGTPNCLVFQPLYGCFKKNVNRVHISALKQDKVTFTPNKAENSYTVFETKSWPFYTYNVFRLRNSGFGSVKIIENAVPDKYSYSGYGTSFDVLGAFSLQNCWFGKNVVISGTDMSSSVHVTNNT